MKSASRIIAASIIALSIGAASAAEDSKISSDRPDFLTGPDVVGKGRFQVELGALVQRDDAGDQRTRTVSTPILLRLGVTESLELRLESEGRTRRRNTNVATQTTTYQTGYADASVGVKWNMQQGDEAKGTPSVGWVVQAELPSGSRAFRGRGARPSIIGAFEWELQNDFAMSVNAGAKYDNHDTEGRFMAAVLGAGVSKGITDRLTMAAEVVGQDLRSKKYGGNVVIADLAVMYLLTPSLQLDALVGRGLTSDSPKYFFTLGVSARF
jgi:hypothetical protein